MEFWARKLRREGVPIPQWQMVQTDWTFAQLTVSEARDDALHRTVRTAHFTDDRGVAVFAPLRDVQLLHMDGARMVLSGFEYGGAVDTAALLQSWVLRAVPP